MTSTLNLKAVLVGIAVVVGLGVEGYQVTHNQPGPINVILPEGFGKVAEAQNATAPNVSPSPPAQTPVGNSTVVETNVTHTKKAPAPQDPAQPPMIRVEQKHKYEWGYDYEFDMQVSALPVEYVPWTGDGVPFINLYYRNVDGTAFQDTGMMHNGYVYNYGYVGYSLCTSQLMRFWNWKVTPPASTEYTNRSLVYSSDPAPEDPNNLFQNGENCYTRVSATSTWMVSACMEGDGAREPYWEETVNGTIFQHFDFMDICFSMLVDTPPVAQSSVHMTVITDPAMLEAMSNWYDAQGG